MKEPKKQKPETSLLWATRTSSSKSPRCIGVGVVTLVKLDNTLRSLCRGLLRNCVYGCLSPVKLDDTLRGLCGCLLWNCVHGSLSPVKLDDTLRSLCGSLLRNCVHGSLSAVKLDDTLRGLCGSLFRNSVYRASCRASTVAPDVSLDRLKRRQATLRQSMLTNPSIARLNLLNPNRRQHTSLGAGTGSEATLTIAESATKATARREVNIEKLMV